MRALAALCLGLAPAWACGQATQMPPYVAGWQELVQRAETGHSPSQDEITAAGALAEQPDAATVAQAVPAMRKALTSPDALVRTYALTALIGLEVPPPTPAAPAAPAPAAADTNPAAANKSEPPPIPTAFSHDVSKALAPIVPELGKELSDETASNRILAATAISGFASDTPLAIYPYLLAYLQRDDGIGPTGDAVVDDLLLLGPISGTTASGIVHYLRRTDQTDDTRANLIESISNHTNQSQAVNQALLDYLTSDDPSVRSRLILSLPQLDLAPDVYTDTHGRLAILASDDQENPQVVRAAKAVLLCWTGPRMTSACPVN